MKVLRIVGCIWLLTLFGGCAVYTPGVAVVVDPHASHPPASRGSFCPPGQAKKGNC